MRLPAITQNEFSYENATLTEDVVWRGSVIVRGSLVIAPQATVRIEPGTVVRFMKSPIFRQAPRLVVLGRIECRGTSDRPVLFAPNAVGELRGEWGGILLLSSEKRNRFESVRIEGATTGIDARFSNFEAIDTTVTRSSMGLLLRDSAIRLTRVTVANCETGLEAHDSGLDLRDSTLVHNRRGMVARRTTLILQAVAVRDSEQQGITADECRIRFSSCEFTGNSSGAQLSRSEGQIVKSRFVANRGIGLDLSASRLKIQQSLFAENSADGVRMDDGQSVIWESAFVHNSGHNLVNNGSESVSAVGNWWGSEQEMNIVNKLYDTSKNPLNGAIHVFPWLPERPVTVP
jgi:hypothetical protein